MNQLICQSQMSSALLPSLDSLAAWRRALGRGVEHFSAVLTDNSLLAAQAQTLLAGVRQQLASDRWVLAFVAEFSRGKAELINAMFFADTGRRLLPATPGRTTMCSVELAKAISTQIDDQLRERRRSLQQRREAHQRIQQAEDGLEFSIASLEAQQAQQQALAQHMASEVDRLSLQANAPPAPDGASHLQLVPRSPTQPERDAA